MADLTVRIVDDPTQVTAQVIADGLADAVERRGRATLAVSGGSTGAPLLAALVATDLPWDDVDIWQVDERVAPDGDPDRNANQLADVPARLHLMPVTASDLDAAAASYAAGLPDRFDVVHLGVGPDGHTASWPPGDPVIESTLAVDLSAEYQGRIRMTLTPPVIDAARERVVLVTGFDKADAIAGWVEGPPAGRPIERVHTDGTVVVLDRAAASRLRSGAS